jgi:hypothetical protein
MPFKRRFSKLLSKTYGADSLTRGAGILNMGRPLWGRSGGVGGVESSRIDKNWRIEQKNDGQD